MHLQKTSGVQNIRWIFFVNRYLVDLIDLSLNFSKFFDNCIFCKKNPILLRSTVKATNLSLTVVLLFIVSLSPNITLCWMFLPLGSPNITWQHYRLNICSYFAWLWQIWINLRRAVLISPASSHFNMKISILTWFPLKVTNLPYMVDEFLRQKILTSGTCTSTTCRFFQVSASQVPQPTFTREVGNLTGYQHHSHPLTSSVPTYLLDIPN